jgi:uncharacterized membrane protein YfcA
LTTIPETFLLVVISVGAGIMATVSGGGGGTFAVPAIVSTINEPPQVLVGSVFLMYTVSSATGLYVYYKKGLVDVRNGVLLSIPAIVGVIVGTGFATNIGGNAFKISLGVLVIVLGVTMLFRPSGFNLTPDTLTSRNTNNKNKTVTIVDKSGRVFEYSPNLAIGYLATFAAGFLNGLFGAGAALIMIPATILFVKMPGHVAIASTRIVLTVLNSVALFAHVANGSIDYYVAVILAIGSVIGSFVGARIAFKASKSHLNLIVAAIFLLIGAYLVISVA